MSLAHLTVPEMSQAGPNDLPLPNNYFVCDLYGTLFWRDL